MLLAPASAADRLPGLDQRATCKRDRLALLVLVLDLGDHEGHLTAAPTLFLVHVGYSRGSGQHVADENRLEELEILLAVENPADIEVRRRHRVLTHPE